MSSTRGEIELSKSSFSPVSTTFPLEAQKTTVLFSLLANRVVMAVDGKGMTKSLVHTQCKRRGVSSGVRAFDNQLFTIND